MVDLYLLTSRVAAVELGQGSSSSTLLSKRVAAILLDDHGGVMLALGCEASC